MTHLYDFGPVKASREICHENTKTPFDRLRAGACGELCRTMISCLRGSCALIAIAILFSRVPFAAPTLPHLRGIGEVRDWFNAGKGHVRLILLLSPT